MLTLEAIVRDQGVPRAIPLGQFEDIAAAWQFAREAVSSFCDVQFVAVIADPAPQRS